MIIYPMVLEKLFVCLNRKFYAQACFIVAITVARIFLYFKQCNKAGEFVVKCLL